MIFPIEKRELNISFILIHLLYLRILIMKIIEQYEGHMFTITTRASFN